MPRVRMTAFALLSTAACVVRTCVRCVSDTVIIIFYLFYHYTAIRVFASLCSVLARPTCVLRTGLNGYDYRTLELSSYLLLCLLVHAWPYSYFHASRNIFQRLSDRKRRHVWSEEIHGCGCALLRDTCRDPRRADRTKRGGECGRAR